jgi:TatA/E family protein of Tat protein translocase
MQLGVPEILILLVIILLVFGAGRIGRLGKEMGEGLRGFRKEMQAGPEKSGVEPVKPAVRPPEEPAAPAEMNEVETKAAEGDPPRPDDEPEEEAGPAGVAAESITHSKFAVGDDNIVAEQVTINHLADLGKYMEPRPLFICSGKDQAAERMAARLASRNSAGIFPLEEEQAVASMERSARQVEAGLGEKAFFLFFAAAALEEAQMEEYRRAKQVCPLVLILAPLEQTGLVAAALGEDPEQIHGYTPEMDLAELILAGMFKTLGERVRMGNPDQMPPAAVKALVGVCTGLGFGAGIAMGLSADWLKELGLALLRAPEVKTEVSAGDPGGGREQRLVLPEEPETVLVPAGEFWMGSKEWDEDASSVEKPYHSVYLDAFRIAKYPVTVAQFERFARGYQTEAEKRGNAHTWRRPRGEGISTVGKEDHPVVNVSWKDAAAYCEWLSRETGKPYRLPTEAEWEKAARGTDGRKYPWGEADPDRARCNVDHWFDGTTPVGYFGKAGESPYGCADMAGNVWEWCQDWWQEDFYRVSPPRNPKGPPKGESHVGRGGSWYDYRGGARCASRGGSWDDFRLRARWASRLRYDPVDFDDFIGFRPVLSLADSGF